MEWESLSHCEKSWEVVVKELAIKLAMRDVVVRLGFTNFNTRKDLVAAAVKMVNSDPHWVEQAREQLCQMN